MRAPFGLRHQPMLHHYHLEKHRRIFIFYITRYVHETCVQIARVHAQIQNSVLMHPISLAVIPSVCIIRVQLRNAIFHPS